MSRHLDNFSRDYRTSYRARRVRWEELCDRYLPVTAEDSIWRFSREPLPEDPEQGWKLHISATILTAERVLQKLAPLLSGEGVLYKAPASLAELDKLNSGIYYGYSQVGKCITVYPRTTEEAVRLARRLHRMTRRLSVPAVPFDSKYRADGCVYYRYGAFKAIDLEEKDGEHTYAIRDGEGNLIPDVRDSATKPDWLADPFLEARAPEATAPPITPLQTTFKAFRALAQRGKGGVYQALDLSASPPRLCILKEGRKNGEVSWDGRDGFWRVRHEGRVLAALLDAGINVPRVYSSFRAEKNYYIVIEFIEGESLLEWLGRRRRRLSVASALRRAVELARLVSRIHSAGWAWRDCKPGNVIITKGGELRPLDFEGACPVNSPDPMPWGTPAYSPPEAGYEFRGQSRLPEDLYALGAVIYLLLAGRPPDASPRVPLEKLRRNIPEDVREVVAEMLDPDPSRRPDASAAARRLKAAIPSNTSLRGQGMRLMSRASAANLGSERRSS